MFRLCGKKYLAILANVSERGASAPQLINRLGSPRNKCSVGQKAKYFFYGVLPLTAKRNTDRLTPIGVSFMRVFRGKRRRRPRDASASQGEGRIYSARKHKLIGAPMSPATWGEYLAILFRAQRPVLPPLQGEVGREQRDSEGVANKQPLSHLRCQRSQS